MWNYVLFYMEQCNFLSAVIHILFLLHTSPDLVSSSGGGVAVQALFSDFHHLVIKTDTNEERQRHSSNGACGEGDTLSSMQGNKLADNITDFCIFLTFPLMV